MSDSDEKKLTVYFDGACPLCRREINFYKGCRGAGDVAWVDVSKEDGDIIGGDLPRQSALKRFHVRRNDGGLASGAEAFAELWMALPAFARPGRWLALPGVRHVAEVTYRAFLVVRPLMQRLTPR